MSRLLLPSAVFAALFACTPWADKDDDADGLLNGAEELAGTDPDNADSDDDGLADGAEAEAGSDPLEQDSDDDGLNDGDEVDEFNTDPTESDSDGDGYDDGDEVNEGSDPDDEDDRIYEGGWPYQADKDDFDGPDLSDADVDEGEEFARVELMDQYGDMVDLYDFAGHGKPILLDVSAEWCPPCQGLASWLAGNDSQGWGDYYPNIKDMVDNGDMYWITVLGEDNYGDQPDLEVLEDWHDSYPNDMIPILSAGSDFASTKYIKGGWPSVYFLDENMEIQVMPVGTSSQFYGALDAANAYEP